MRFPQNIATGMMLSKDGTVPDSGTVINVATPAIEVDLTDTDTASVQFLDGAWSTISAD
jgi:hypothetical protein